MRGMPGHTVLVVTQTSIWHPLERVPATPKKWADTILVPNHQKSIVAVPAGTRQVGAPNKCAVPAHTSRTPKHVAVWSSELAAMSLQCAILGCALLAVIVHAQPLEAAALAAPIIGEVIGAVIGGVAPLKLVVVASALAALSQRRAGGFAGAADAGTHARRHALHLRKERRVADRRVVAGVGRSVYLVLVPHLSALEFTVYPCHEGAVSAACVWSPTVHFRNRVSQCMCRLWFVCTASHRLRRAATSGCSSVASCRRACRVVKRVVCTRRFVPFAMRFACYLRLWSSRN